MKNSLLYNASIALINAARFVKPVDREYSKVLLDKAEEFKNQIVIDEGLEAEVIDFEERIRKGL